eukprot:scaffold914_cov218-Amphora_coffeaeformis.AAC.3
MKWISLESLIPTICIPRESDIPFTNSKTNAIEIGGEDCDWATLFYGTEHREVGGGRAGNDIIHK